MKENLYLTLIDFFTMFILLFLQVISLNISRKNIYLGVRIPENKRKDPELIKIGKSYTYVNIVIGVPLITLFSICLYFINNVLLFQFSIFIFLIIDFLIYYKFNRRVSKLKAEKGWLKTKKQVLVIDTKLSSKRIKECIVSPIWFVPSVLLIIMCLLVNIKCYKNLPIRYPSHWNSAGIADGYSLKSYGTIYEMPVIQTVMLVVTFFSYKIIGWAKQEISAVNPEASIEKNIKFRRIWSVYMIATSYLIQFVFIVSDFQMMQIIKFNVSNFVVFQIIIEAVVMIISIVLTIKVGQGGSKLKSSFDGKENEDEINTRDDDKYWKLGGTIYYNKDDPAIFVEKRFGIGWTFNAGSKIGFLLYLVIIVIIIFSLAATILKI